MLIPQLVVLNQTHCLSLFNDWSIAAPNALLRTEELPLDSGGEKATTNHPD